MTESQIQFDREAHRYSIGEKHVLSVTQILKEAGLIDDRWFTEESRIRGTAVHEAVFFDIHSDLDKSNLHEVISGYMEGWFRFKTETSFIPTKNLCELRMYHQLHDYAGTPDIVGALNNRRVLIDIKTGDCPTAQFQTAAYREFPKIRALSPDRFSLRLFSDGRYSLIPHTNPNDFLVFLDALKKVKSNSKGENYAKH